MREEWRSTLHHSSPDNGSVINYDQLYAQMMYELRDKFEYV